MASLGHPCKFQLVSRLGSVTAQNSSSGRQTNFAALNRGRHLYSAGRPSRWTLAHILFVVVVVVVVAAAAAVAVVVALNCKYRPFIRQVTKHAWFTPTSVDTVT